MNESSDAELLKAYSDSHAESAFNQLVRRHVDFVYSAALRMVRDPHLAEDVTQSVFIALAQNASQLQQRSILSGWLHLTARNIAAQTVRTIERRRAREQYSIVMNPEPSQDPWDDLAPHLDAVLGDLNEPDREALLLRYFERKSAREMALTLGISDEAAQKRVARAIDRLRDCFSRRGISVGASGLATLISTNAVQAAPTGLIAAIPAAAAAGVTTFTSAAAAAATKTIAMTALQKSAVVASLMLAGFSFYESRQTSNLREQFQAIQQRHAPLAAEVEELRQNHEATTRELSSLRNENNLLKAETARWQSVLAEHQNTRQAALPQPSATAAPARNPPSDALLELENIGRDLGLAVVRGEQGAFDRILNFAKASLADFKKESAGLNDNQQAELSRQTFVPMRAAFKVIEEAARQNNGPAVDAVVRSLLIPELRSYAVLSIGLLAGDGNEDALNVLLNPNYGFNLSSTVSALRPAAENGNPKAIEAIAAVTQDPKNRALWLLAAQGLSKPAGEGNPTAIAALIRLSGTTNSSIKSIVVAGLEAAANRQNPAAIETLRSLGLR